MSEKIPCTRCGAMILESTARTTNGICMPCKIGFRKFAPKTKLEKYSRKAYGIAVGTIAMTAIVIAILINGLVKSPRSGKLLDLTNANIASNYYLDQSFEFIDGNNRIVVSIKSGKVDFIVFTKKNKRNYPKYTGTEIDKNKAVGFIMRSSYNDKINITNSKKAYEIGNDAITELPINIKMSAFEVPKLAKLLGTEFTIDKLNQIKDKI